jgi:hypothetical protein
MAALAPTIVIAARIDPIEYRCRSSNSRPNSHIQTASDVMQRKKMPAGDMSPFYAARGDHGRPVNSRLNSTVRQLTTRHQHIPP